MWKVSFNKDTYKKVKVFNNKATIVTLKAKVVISKEVAKQVPLKIFDWMQKPTNPKVTFDPYTGIIELKAKGKTVRKNEDENKPLFAERLAECRAKMSIYKFMITLTEQYGKYYMELLFGKNAVIYPTEDSSIPNRDSVWGAVDRYVKLWNREYNLCIKLQKELKRW